MGLPRKCLCKKSQQQNHWQHSTLVRGNSAINQLKMKWTTQKVGRQYGKEAKGLKIQKQNKKCRMSMGTDNQEGVGIFARRVQSTSTYLFSSKNGKVKKRNGGGGVIWLPAALDSARIMETNCLIESSFLGSYIWSYDKYSFACYWTEGLLQS